MERESRVKKSLLNARVNLIFYFLTLALSFFSRKIFLDTLGADFVGLTGTLQNLLGFLNLAELGIGSAIGYVLYKPLFDHDESKINEIISVFGYLYRWIGFIILGAGLVLACFLPLIFPDTKFEMGIIFFAYFSFLISSLIGYFANYKQTLLGADQKNYVVTAYFQTATIIKTLIQMASAYYTGSYYLWVVIELVFGIIYSIILNWKINQVYPWLKSEVRLGKQLFKKYPEVMKYSKQIFIHQIASFFQFQTTPLFVYAFASLKLVTYYGNYTLIVDKLCQLMNTVLGSTAAGVGNLIAEGNMAKIESVFWEITGIRSWIAGIFAFVLYNTLNGLIIWWLGEHYLLSDSILLLLTLKIYIQIATGSIGQFVSGFGLFADVWSSFLQVILFVIIAIVGGYWWGLHGIIIAAIASIFFVVGIWKPYYLYTYGFKQSVWRYWYVWSQYVILTVVSVFLSYSILSQMDVFFNTKNIVRWMMYSTCVLVLYSLISFIVYYIFIKRFRCILHRFIKK